MYAREKKWIEDHDIYFEPYELRLHWFESCLKQLSESKYVEKDSTILFPYKIGCCRAGGNWPNYLKMICDFAENNQHLEIIIVKLIK